MSVAPDSRYAGLPVVEDGDRLGLALRPPSDASGDPEAFVHVLVSGETLDSLSLRYYGVEDYWWRIADANPRRFAFEWAPGEEIVIPSLRGASGSR